MDHAIVSREEWLEARKALLAKEREMTHALDALRAERRALPWVRIDKNYIFTGPAGECTLDDLFGGARRLFEQAALAFAAVSRAPIERIEAVKARMGWTFPWVSSQGCDFNADFGVYFSPEDRAAGRAIYNYGTLIERSPDMFGVSIFVKDATGAIFHTYSTYHRGVELLIGAFNWLDLAPKGRN